MTTIETKEYDCGYCNNVFIAHVKKKQLQHTTWSNQVVCPHCGNFHKNNDGKSLSLKEMK